MQAPSHHSRLPSPLSHALINRRIPETRWMPYAFRRANTGDTLYRQRGRRQWQGRTPDYRGAARRAESVVFTPGIRWSQTACACLPADRVFYLSLKGILSLQCVITRKREAATGGLQPVAFMHGPCVQQNVLRCQGTGMLLILRH